MYIYILLYIHNTLQFPIVFWLYFHFSVVCLLLQKYAGYFNPETKSFAVDPHLTTFEDLQKILVQAFNLNGYVILSVKSMF